MFESLEGKGVPKEDLILYWRQHPCEAAKDLLDVELDTHQRIVLKCRWTSTREIDVLSRGTGKTFLDGVFASLRCMLYPGHRVGIIGPSFRQSKLVFAEIEKLWMQSPAFQEAAPDGPKKMPESFYMNFASAPGRAGSYLEAMPLGPDGAKIRGARFYDVIADEGAQIDDEVLDVVVQGFLATSADPMARVRMMAEQQEQLKRGLITADQIVLPPANKFIISSTAYYQYNHLWRRVQQIMEQVLPAHRRAQRDGTADMNKFWIAGLPLNGGQIPYRVISDGNFTLTAFTYKDPSPGFMNLQSIEEAKRTMSDYLFRMEYECYFPPDSEGFFRRQLLDHARGHKEFSCQAGPRKGMIYAMGVDPARSGDNFAVAIFEIDPILGTISLVRVLSWNKKSFPLMQREIRKLIKHYGVKYFKMDAGGGGTTIRDLLANRENCPPGERLILEEEFDEHMPLVGDKILGPLVQFSSSEWVHDANHNLLSGLQHGQLRIAAQPPCGGELYTPDKEDMDTELEAALVEMSTIITTQVGSRTHWDTPTKNQRKDRYSAILIGYDAARILLSRAGRGPTLAFGFFA